eukprot:3998177-Lingulodinium_polyedra.AAC.1
MGQFGSDTAKPLDLYSTFPYIEAMRRNKPPPTGETLVVRSACGGGITGKRSVLKMSAAYTYEFGKCFAKAVTTYFADVSKDNIDVSKYKVAHAHVCKRPLSAATNMDVSKYKIAHAPVRKLNVPGPFSHSFEPT